MIKKMSLVLDTVKNLKLTQIWHQVIYRINRPKLLTVYSKTYKLESPNFLEFQQPAPVYTSVKNNSTFSFLNQEVVFDKDIDWNFQGYGKLWNYNLQYGNYLLQSNLPIDYKINLIISLQDWLNSGKLPLEPYPSSLRSINLIRLLSKEEIVNESLLKNLYGEVNFLSQRPEYHLLGNHLLENAFAIVMGGAFFANRSWINQGVKILEKELNEQILSDGAHFELSPMYHQIILFRVLEFIDWYSSFSEKALPFEKFVRIKASSMLGWLQNMTFDNGDIPHLNDSSIGIAYSTEWLKQYAASLNIEADAALPLNESGYRAIKAGKLECIIDLAEIGPSYQPGHGHADALSFILYYKDTPIFIEQGTSTYQIGARRSLERSTSAHNTVVVGGKNQSDIWSGFRVGSRASVSILEESPLRIVACHNGYQSLGLIHQRTFDFANDTITVIDEIKGVLNNNNNIAYFHCHPQVEIELNNDILILGEYGQVKFAGAKDIKIERFDMAQGYNSYATGQRVVVCFAEKLTTEIHLI